MKQIPSPARWSFEAPLGKESDCETFPWGLSKTISYTWNLRLEVIYSASNALTLTRRHEISWFIFIQERQQQLQMTAWLRLASRRPDLPCHLPGSSSAAQYSGMSGWQGTSEVSCVEIKRGREDAMCRGQEGRTSLCSRRDIQRRQKQAENYIWAQPFGKNAADESRRERDPACPMLLLPTQISAARTCRGAAVMSDVIRRDFCFKKKTQTNPKHQTGVTSFFLYILVFPSPNKSNVWRKPLSNSSWLIINVCV